MNKTVVDFGDTRFRSITASELARDQADRSRYQIVYDDIVDNAALNRELYRQSYRQSYRQMIQQLIEGEQEPQRMNRYDEMAVMAELQRRAEQQIERVREQAAQEQARLAKLTDVEHRFGGLDLGGAK